LAKTLSKLNIAVNPLYEIYLNYKQEVGLDAGISWELDPKLVLGLESTSRINIYKDGSTKSGSYFGPTVSVASGGWWYTAGAALGLTDDSDPARVRSLNRVVVIIIVFLVTVIGGCSWQMAGVNMTSGERLFRSNCRSCHTLPNPKSQTDSDWVSLVKRYGSQIDLVPEVQAKIIAYLQRVN
jgi:hypothetical protein